MSINNRKHTRFSLDIPATLLTKYGERQQTVLQQISVGGCFTDWEENIFSGDEFRLEIELPNKNKLPLRCKAIYRFEDTGIGVKFTDISQFEQELLAKVITNCLHAEGLPTHFDPFDPPQTKFEADRPRITTARHEREMMLEKIMSGDE